MVFASIGDAFHRTADILFKPFSAGRWARLVVIAWIAGGLFGGISLNWNARATEKDAPREQASAKRPASDASLGKRIERQHEKKYWYEHSLIKTFRGQEGEVPGWYMNLIVWPILIFLVLLVIALALFWVWLASRFQFVWLNAARTGETAIRKPLRVFESCGDSLATFWLLALLAAAVYYAAVGVLPMYLFFKAVNTAPLLFKSGMYLVSVLWPWLLLVLFSLAVTLVLWSVLSDFVVPIMASESLSVREAFGRWLAVYRKNRWAVWRYFMTKFVAALLAGAFSTAASVVVMIVFGLAGAAVFGLLYLVFMTWLKLKVVFWVLAAIAGIPFFSVMILAFGASALPASLFFRTFSLSFLERLSAPREV